MSIRVHPWLPAFVGVCLVCSAWGADVQAASFDATHATYDELLYRATRYGNTEQRRADKAAAREVLFARGADALREMMARAHAENIMLHVLANEAARYHVPPDEALAALAESLASEHAQTRRLAAYLMGFHPGRAYADRVLPLLDDEACRNAAIRTLGKWRIGRAREPLRGFLHGDKERTRIVACTALGDIRNPDDLPALVDALGDPVFTVRNAAARAIATFGWDAQRPLLRALQERDGAAQRQAIRLLGELRVQASVRPLRRLLDHADPGVRADAALALRRIDPSGAHRWLRGMALPPVESEPLFH